MSRNLGTVDCHECPGHHEHVVLEEAPRPVMVGDVFEHFLKDYEGLIVAHARCVLCHTLYLAWVDWPAEINRRERGYGHWDLAKRKETDPDRRFCDLSYRHAFNDEPSSLDLPIYEVEAVVVYKRAIRKEHAYARVDEEPTAPYAAGSWGPAETREQFETRLKYVRLHNEEVAAWRGRQAAAEAEALTVVDDLARAGLVK